MCDCDRAAGADFRDVNEPDALSLHEDTPARMRELRRRRDERCTGRTSAQCRVASRISEHHRGTSSRSLGIQCTGHRDAARCRSQDPCRREHRTTLQAGRVKAMVACASSPFVGTAPRPWTPIHQSHVAPGFVVIESIQRMTGADAGLASRAKVEVHVKGILLTTVRPGGRDQIAVITGLGGKCRALMLLCEPLDGREPLLLRKERRR